MLCVVQKQFGGPSGSVFEQNQLVEASTFRNRDALIANRFLRLATAEEIASAEEEEDETSTVPVRPTKKPMTAPAKRTTRGKK